LGDEVEIVKAGVEAALKPLADLLDKIAGPAAEELGLSLKDNVVAWRFRRQVRLLEQTNEMMKRAGLKPKQVPFKLLAPIVQNASLEDDDGLQNRWAALLANNASGKYTETVFPEILKQLSAADAHLLNMCLREILSEPTGRNSPPTHTIESTIKDWREVLVERWRKPPPFPLSELSLGNLIRLGLVASPHPEWDALPSPNFFPRPGDSPTGSRTAKAGKYRLSGIGVEFVYACADPAKLQEVQNTRSVGIDAPDLSWLD
jgi:hypothetical protein